MHKQNIINCQKLPKWSICAFSKVPTKRRFVRFLCRNTKKTIFWGIFFKNQKCTFLGVHNGTFLKSNFKFVFLNLLFNVKGSFKPIFPKKILIFGPPGIIWKLKLWRAWIWTSKIIPGLWLDDLFCPIKKDFHNPHSTLIGMKQCIRALDSLSSTRYLTTKINSAQKVRKSTFLIFFL